MLKSSLPPLKIKFSPDFGMDLTRNEYLVITNLRDGWSVFKYGARRAYRSFKTRAEAVRFGRELAKKHHGELVIHREDASVLSCVSYGDDAARSRKRAR